MCVHSATHTSTFHGAVNTYRSTADFATCYDPYMSNWSDWPSRAKALKAEGQKKDDAEISVLVSEILEASGREAVGRGAVNHWLTGKRVPNVFQYFALCQVLECDPKSLLTGDEKAPDSAEQSTSVASRPAVQPSAITETERALIEDFRRLMEPDQAKVAAKIRELADVARYYEKKFGPRIADNGHVNAALPPAPSLFKNGEDVKKS